VLKQYPELELFQGVWPVYVNIQQYLKNTSEQECIFEKKRGQRTENLDQGMTQNTTTLATKSSMKAATVAMKFGAKVHTVTVKPGVKSSAKVPAITMKAGAKSIVIAVAMDPGTKHQLSTVISAQDCAEEVCTFNFLSIR
jgi:hypothetical protein